MSLDFSKVTSWRVPEGEVSEVTDAQGNILWSIIEQRYISLGDSIAAGHTIDNYWKKTPLGIVTDEEGKIHYQYEGTKSQYTETLTGASQPNQKTIIVNNSYTDRINKDLKTKYGTPKVYTLSFAHSGDTVANLISKLNHTRVQDAISKADIVTICIGANDILGHVYPALEPYITSGDLSQLEGDVKKSLVALDTDSNSNSYISLFNKLNSFNSNAKFVFTTVYNPYKYLWIDEDRNGFFKPLLDYIPNWDITVPGVNYTFSLSNIIKDGILSTTYIQLLFDRVNGLCNWVEKFVEGSSDFNGLNRVLKNKIKTYQQQGHSNFYIANTKELFDIFPDRDKGTICYDDLVNVEFTRGYTTKDMDWEALWIDDYSSGGAYWEALRDKYIWFTWDEFDWSNPIWSVLHINWDDMAYTLMMDTINKVIVPNVDPHPEEDGQYVLSRSFEDIIGLSSLDPYTIKYNANGGNGSMNSRVIYSVDGLPAYNIALDPVAFVPPQTGYRFTGWKDQYGNSYSNGQLITLNSSNTLNSEITLTAQWSNIYKVIFRHTYDSSYHNSSDTGPQEKYAFWIDGVEQSDLGAFSNDGRVYYLPYGTSLGVIAQVKNGSDRSYITFNGQTVNGQSNDARYGFTLTSDTDILFEWNYWFDGIIPQSYWNCYITTNI
jgi:lysophospholipase L1-like esterase